MRFSFPAARALPVALALALSPSLAPAYVGQWHSFTDHSHVTSLVEHGGYVYAGTTGGIRRVTPAGSVSAIQASEVEFDNLDGLLDVWVQSLLTSSDGALWAVSREGYLYRQQGNRWETYGRSYASLGWKMNPRAALSTGTRFFLGSEKGLTLFDGTEKVSQLNVVRFRTETDVSVLSFLRRADTLFVGTNHGIFKSRVYFADPLNPPITLGFPNLADPNTWIKVRPDTAYSLILSGDSVVAGPAGTQLDSPVAVTAHVGAPLSIGGHAYPEFGTGFVSALASQGKVFAAGDAGLFVSLNPSNGAGDAALLSPLRAYPRDTIYNIGAAANKVWGFSPGGIHSLGSDGSFIHSPAPLIPMAELITRDLRNIKVGENGDVFVGTWGSGLGRVHNGSVQLWNHGSDTCIFQAFTNNPWTVAAAISAPKNGGVYFSVFRTEGSADHQLVFLDIASNTLYCPDAGTSVPGGYPHAIQAFSNSLLGVGSEKGLALYETQQGFSGPTLTFRSLWTVAGSSGDAWDLATGTGGRPWALIGGTLASVDLDSIAVSTSFHLKAVDNFAGQNCKSLESDASGSLWAGCANGLFHLATSAAGDASLIRRYGLDDGLMSQSILDVAVDSSTGRVWVATDRGVSMLEGPGQPAIQDGAFSTITPYPNPFKPEHRFVIFNNLPSNSTLRIHNSTGTVVRTFRPSDMSGNEVHWDGKNEDGKAVAAGVYLFSVASGSSVKRGKVIVAR